MLPPVDLDAYSLNKAMKGVGTNEGTLISILCSKSGPEINDIKKVYKSSKYFWEQISPYLVIILFVSIVIQDTVELSMVLSAGVFKLV